jgi:hypothetical protein
VTIPLVDSLIDYLAQVKAFETWGKLHANQQSHHVSIGMDSYAKLDFISLDFVCLLGLEPCQKCCHNHHIPHIKAAGCSSLKTHGVYHLHGTLMDC